MGGANYLFDQLPSIKIASNQVMALDRITRRVGRERRSESSHKEIPPMISRLSS